MDELVTTKTALRRGCGLGGDPRGITERTWVPVIKPASHSQGRAQPIQHQVAVPKHCHCDTPSHFHVLLSSPCFYGGGPQIAIIAFPVSKGPPLTVMMAESASVLTSPKGPFPAQALVLPEEVRKCLSNEQRN